MERIAALITCFNRREKTLKCLASLYVALPTCDVYLVDDASSDGTAQAVREQFPAVNLIEGGGDLFWSRGMYTAWKHALCSDYDYYLWLNDDVELYPFSYDELMECNRSVSGVCVVFGLVELQDGSRVIYGGYDANGSKLHATGQMQKAACMNGNVVLIPRSVVEKIGIMDPRLHHDLGDFDYGLRAIEAGIDLWSTRMAVASGDPNAFCRVRKWNTTLGKRFRKLYSPLGSPPCLSFYFRRKHFGIVYATGTWIFLHILNLLPDRAVTMIWGDRYRDK